ncbi:Rhamnogalacturonate lyase [Bienertia sinuspersici]
MQNDNQVELSFSTPWNGDSNAIPLNLDKRYIMLKGSSGFYNYITLDHERSFPATNLSQIRVAYKPHMQKFRYMVISDDIQKIMPMDKQVEDKYQYSEDMKDQQVHGWISSDDETSFGFWLIKPTTEYYSAGPFKQDLTSHLGPTSLVSFFDGHYAGENMQIILQDGESWQKVVGPYFVYLNKVSGVKDPYAQLWSNAKKQTIEYELIPGKSAWVGLAAPVHEGEYSLYAWVPGFIGEYVHNTHIIVQQGKIINLGEIIYEPLRNGPTLWEIGTPDRTAAEFFVRFNDINSYSRPLFSTSLIGFDNAIARHGIHGLYWLFSVNVPGSLLLNGENTLYLTQAVAANPFCGVMYDYIRLEGPSS